MNKVNLKKILCFPILIVLVFSFIQLTQLIFRNDVVAVEDEKPIIFSVSDSVEPGNTVNISGNYLSGVDEIALKQLPDGNNSVIDFPDETCIRLENISFNGEKYGSGISFTFPSSEQIGRYALWVKNDYGWSNSIILNEVRPLYLDTDGAYEGLPVQIIGRNLANPAGGFDNVYVKLKRNANLEGEIDGNNEEIIVPASQSLRYDSEQSLIKDKCIDSNIENAQEVNYGIYDSNEYKITFYCPHVSNYGRYEISVSNSGRSGRFVPLSEKQDFFIYERKGANWNDTVFGDSDSTIGNDPLNLKVWWAQDLNYTNVITMIPNNIDPLDQIQEGENQSVNDLTKNIQSAIRNLSNNGGGVLYFPAGDYYFHSVQLFSNVLLIGDGQGITNLYYVGEGKSSFLRGYDYWPGVGAMRGISNCGIARMTISHSQESGNPEYYVNLNDGAYDKLDVRTKTAENKFVTDIEFKSTTSTGSSAVAVSISGLRRAVGQNLSLNGVNGIAIEPYQYAIIRNVDYTALKGGTPHFQSKYCVIENCCFDLNYGGHGPSVRSDTYLGNSMTLNSGDRENKTNDGEVILFEVPGGYFSVGSVISGTARQATLKMLSGNAIDENTKLLYNDFAVYIVSGKGEGQLRYINKQPINSNPESNIFTYSLAEYERDWDVIPDSSSRFTIISPIKNITVYNYRGYDCASSLTFYSCVFDAVVSDCSLKDTGGISINSVNLGLHTANNGTIGRFCPDANILIKDNFIEGTAANYNIGYTAYQGTGGILLYSENTYVNDNFPGMMISMVEIRNNTLKNIVTKENIEPQCNIPNKSLRSHTLHGIVVYTTGYISESYNNGDVRNLIIENNIIDVSERGIYTESGVDGLIIRNNSIVGRRYGEKDVETYFSSGTSISSTYEFWYNGESIFKGEFYLGGELPIYESEEGEFIGWSVNEDSVPGEVLQTTADIATNTNLYARFDPNFIFNNINLSNDEVGLDFFIEVSDRAKEDGYFLVDFGDENNLKRIELSSAENITDDLYVLSVGIDARNYDRKIKLNCCIDSNILQSKSLSVKEVIESTLEAGENNENYDYMIAVKNYCERAKEYLNGDTVKESKFVDYEKYLNAAKQEISSSLDCIALDSFSIVLRSKVSMRIYFFLNSVADKISVKIDGNLVEFQSTGNENEFYVEIGESKFSEFGEIHSLVFETEGNKVQTVKINILAYLKDAITKQGGEIKNLALAAIGVYAASM